jgi:hypothetical protein
MSPLSINRLAYSGVITTYCCDLCNVIRHHLIHLNRTSYP